jgi:hypothetical protein
MEYHPYRRIIVKISIVPHADLDTPWLRFMLNAVLASLTVDPDRSVEDLTIECQAAAALGWNDPTPSGTSPGKPIPTSIAGLELTPEEREALACFAAAMTQAA